MASVKSRKPRPEADVPDLGPFKRLPPAVLDREPRSGELRSGLADIGTFKRLSPTVEDIGTFKRLPPAVLDRLIAKGRKDAEELDRLIRDQFVMTAEDAQMRLD
jgi:hypothetical protein